MNKILVIDDDVIARKIVKNCLEPLGYVVVQSSNGRHGWETLWENSDVKMVITDLMMPDMDGRELLHIIRGNEAFVNLPVLVMSGVAKKEEVSDLLQLGETRFVNKPLQMKEISALVDELIGATSYCAH